MADKIEKIIADTFLQMAEGLETGNFGKKPRIALTGMGSEHGEENAMEAAKMAAKDGIDVYYIGTLEADGVTTVKVTDDEEGHKKMEEMLASHEVDGAVTMHFPFPIGESEEAKLYHRRHAVAEDGKPDGSDSHRSVQSGTEYHRGK